ncbi:uncharacterized protein B0I36DRAFT_258234 [Microdochium trichocladiopsis]|uniref:NAD(P)-binding protein n=1 Tax=Microdochium trichocladiopsis TaxID=1682393 RepID=A0A9P8XP38_9PEZI|nr:uncharacterized protein B0I36DRAFT_258234 [Microdochium trichocladiopsis]KAH7007966.1 hypothetical protein B0I36DRAFT_258234 [Microdochium trichocladiopsis]
MPPLSTIRVSNSRITAATAPRVAVFTGATQGIGKATLTQLVGVGTPITIYLIGRNGSTQEGFLEELRASNQQAKIVWLEGQVSLLSETKRLCDEIKSREKSIDLLFFCAAYVALGGRRDTSEGYDTAITLAFWGRALFTSLLLPLLRNSAASSSSSASASPSYAPRVISIGAAGLESASVPLDDLDLKSPKIFGPLVCAKTCATMSTVFYDHLASSPGNEGVVFIYNHPGNVDTNILKNGWGEGSWGPTLVGLVQRLVWPLIRLFGVGGITAAVSGERSLFLCTSAMFGGRGVSVDGCGRGRTLAGREMGGIFCVPENIECIQPQEVVGKLFVNGGREKILEKVDEVLKPYL